MLLTWPVRRDVPRIPFGDAVVRELPVLAALEHVVAAIARAEDGVDAAVTAQVRVVPACRGRVGPLRLELGSSVHL